MVGGAFELATALGGHFLDQEHALDGRTGPGQFPSALREKMANMHEGETPAERLLAPLSLLPARPSWTAEELSGRLGVTPRTVRRAVTRLRTLGYPVDAEPGPYGGYRLGAGAALPPLLLDDDEAVAVVVGLHLAAGHGVAGYEDAAVAALVKLEQVMPARLRERAAALRATAFPRPRPGRDRPGVAPETLVLVAQACRRLERLRFTYVDAQDRATERLVEPFQVVHADRRWYLVARDPARADWRTFRLDRMRAVALSGHRFVRTDEPDARRLVEVGVAVAAHTWQAEVELPVPVEEAAAVIPPTVGVLEPAGDGVTRLRIGGDLDWVARYLVSLPFASRVVAPDELRAELHDLGARLQQAHASSGSAPASSSSR